MAHGDDIIKQTTKFLVVGNTLHRKFSYCSREVKIELFRSHCYSIYCNSLWSRFKVATLNCLKVCHNDILKRLLGLPRWCSSSLAFAKNGVNNLDVIHRHSVFSLNESVAVTDLEYYAQSDTERKDAGHVCYEEKEPQIVMGSYMFEPEYEVNEQVIADPEVQQEDLALLQNMDWNDEMVWTITLRNRVELSANFIITSVSQSSAYVCGSIQQRWLGLLFLQNVG
ncbi:hypothetical protein GWK47_033299 [Chionoecetes opilio]|uniref:Uncharacterized protein n=1 Tax=Chionoecetes opilio TaxID=41210 RepID=A0A8J4YH02_CHIOP|nr:hypothetical protein GWK47_033299 [Chionoecetes opilio]